MRRRSTARRSRTSCAPSTVAAFNSAFRLDDARGGFWDEGNEVRPLVNGQASLVIDKDGCANVVAWGRDRQIDPNVAQVRQNLALVVDNGQSAAGLDSEATTKWGATVGQPGARVALRHRRRQERRPHLHRGTGPVGEPARRAVPAGRRGAGDGARHQLRLDHRLHLRADRPRTTRRRSSATSCCPT